jgi:phosphopantothenoylcysteine decarboxylase / phosphopantothenate---cysteine ligase
LGIKLNNKNILITAGPTWVPIDSVRVISNIATGQTGILLSQKFKKAGAKVTLLLGPQEACCLDKGIKVIRFKFFGEIKNLLRKEVGSLKFDAVIHSAAVSDYKPDKSYSYKVGSNLNGLKVNLIPTEKIIDRIKKIDPNVFLVGFKFEPDCGKEELIIGAKKLMQRSGSDLVVANSIGKNGYLAYIVSSSRIHGPLYSKNALAKKMINLIGGLLCKN